MFFLFLFTLCVCYREGKPVWDSCTITYYGNGDWSRGSFACCQLVCMSYFRNFRDPRIAFVLGYMPRRIELLKAATNISRSMCRVTLLHQVKYVNVLPMYISYCLRYHSPPFVSCVLSITVRECKMKCLLSASIMAHWKNVAYLVSWHFKSEILRSTRLYKIQLVYSLFF